MSHDRCYWDGDVKIRSGDNQIMAVKKKSIDLVPKESGSKGKSSEDFKKRKYSEVGSSVLEDLKRATEAEKKHRDEGRES